MQPGSTLTIRARTIAISCRHLVLLLFHSAKCKIVEARVRILLGSIRPPRGRQSRNESDRISIIRIVLFTCDNNVNRCEFPYRSTSAFSSILITYPTSEVGNGGNSDS